MEAVNYVAQLNEYVQESRSEIKYDDGPGHIKTFTQRVILNGQPYPVGVGKSKKEARQNAAKHALEELDQNSSLDSGLSGSQFDKPVYLPNLTHPTACGRNKKEAKEEAAKLAYEEIVSDLPSKVSVKSAVSEEEATSNTAPTEWESLNSTSSSGIQFKDTSEPAKNPPTENTTNSRFLNEFDEFELLGKGGFGRVYKARLKLLSQDYAVKIVPHKLKALREAKVLAKLDHRNIVRYFSVWSEQSDYNSASESSSTSQSSTDWSGPYLYIQMELCEKKNLDVWIDERNVTGRDPARREDSRAIMQKIMCGVEYIHHSNLIHRDLKPLNIMFASNGEVKIGDFGLVTKDIDDTAGERTRSAGTRSFMAPEQESTNIYDRKVDIFALGLIYFKMLWPIFTGHEMNETWGKIRLQTFPPDFERKFPQEKDIINSMLQESPGDRPHAKDVKDKLRFDILQQSQSSEEE